MNALRRGALLAVLSIAAGRQAAAQELPAVRAAVQLATEGRSDSARALLNGELRRVPAGGPAWVEILYWRGRLGSSGDSVERDLRRVAIEFSSSPWADDALLQLSQLALAAGNPGNAYELALRMRSDYPDSELRPQAALWAARAAFSTGEARSACGLLSAARNEAAGDVEFVNQVDFYRARCASISTAGTPANPPAPGATPPATRQAPVAPAPSAAPPQAGQRQPTFEVQVAATRSEQSARDVQRRLARAGLQARVLSGEDGMRRVRLGPFPSRAEADSVAMTARRIAGGTPFVVTIQP